MDHPHHCPEAPDAVADRGESRLKEARPAPACGLGAWKAVLVVVLSLLVASSVFLGLKLVLVKFEQRMVALTVSRLALVADEVRRRSETGLSLGLRLPELEDLSASLQRAMATGAALRIDICDERGAVVFSSDPGMAGHRPPGLGALHHAARGYRYQVTGDVLDLRMPLQNDAGVAVGQVIVLASVREQQQQVRLIASQILEAAAALVLGVLLVAALGVGVTLRASAALLRNEARP